MAAEMVEMVSVTDLCGTGYSVGPRQRFRVTREHANQLIAKGSAFPYREPVDRAKYAVYETKDIVPEAKGSRR